MNEYCVYTVNYYLDCKETVLNWDRDLAFDEKYAPQSHKYDCEYFPISERHLKKKKIEHIARW